MQYVLSLCDDRRQHLVVFTLREADVKRPAADFFFEIVASPPEQLADDGIISAGQSDDLLAMQERLFAEDSQGLFIREDVSISSNGNGLNPDEPLKNAFIEADREGTKYMRSETIVATATKSQVATGPTSQTADEEQNAMQRVVAFARIWFIWQIAHGYPIDVTKDDPDLADSIAEAEKNGWIEIDTKKAVYALTAKGLDLFRSYKEECQDLVRRYDIYGDVDVDSAGNVRFDTELGRDLRIPIFELAGVDPFKARLLLGLNDGEWRDIPDWTSHYQTREFYDKLLQDVAYAPAIDDIGKDVLVRIMDSGKAELRADGQFN